MYIDVVAPVGDKLSYSCDAMRVSAMVVHVVVDVDVNIACLVVVVCVAYMMGRMRKKLTRSFA
eukprot:4932231-Amphidinium_carterae.1